MLQLGCPPPPKLKLPHTPMPLPSTNYTPSPQLSQLSTYSHLLLNSHYQAWLPVVNLILWANLHVLIPGTVLSGPHLT